jgi:hypothetical protein
MGRQVVAKTMELEAARAKVAEVDEEIGGLERQLRQARDASREASQRLADAASRQNELAIPILNGDEEAAAENEQLEGVLVVENRRVATANSAVAQLQRLIEEQKEARREALKGVEAAKGEKLTVKAREHAKQIDEHLAPLAEVLEGLAATMEVWRQALVRAGLMDPSPTAGVDVGYTLRNYLAWRLGQKWMRDSLPTGYRYPKSVSQALYIGEAEENEEPGAA